MNPNQEENSGPDTLLSAWMKASEDFLGSLFKMWPGSSGTPETSTPSEEDKKSRKKPPWEVDLKSWKAFSTLFSHPEAMDTFSKVINTPPEIVLKMVQVAYQGYFNLQQQWLERMGRIGKSTEAYKFEDLHEEPFKAWAEIYENEFRQFLTIPPLGLSRFYQERMAQATDRFNIFQASMAEFIHLLSLPMEKTNQVFQEKMAALIEEGKSPENFQDYYRIWIKILEGHYMTLFKSPEYTQSLAKVMETMEKFIEARQAVLQDMLQFLPVPTNKDMDDLYRELYFLKKKVKELTKKLDQQKPEKIRPKG